MFLFHKIKALGPIGGLSRVRAAGVFIAGATVLLLVAGCVDNRIMHGCRVENGRLVDSRACRDAKQSVRSEKSWDSMMKRRQEERKFKEEFQRKQARKRAAAASRRLKQKREAELARMSPRERAALEKRKAAKAAAWKKAEAAKNATLKQSNAAALRKFVAGWKREQARPEYQAILRKYPRIAWLSGIWCRTPSGRRHRYEILANGGLRSSNFWGAERYYSRPARIEKRSYITVRNRGDLHILVVRYGYAKNSSYGEWVVRKLSENQYKNEWSQSFYPGRRKNGKKEPWTGNFQRCDGR